MRPGPACAAQTPQGILNFGSGFFAFDSQTEADGNSDTFLPGGAAPRSGVEVASTAPTVSASFRRASTGPWHTSRRTDRVTGQANPLDDATASRPERAPPTRSAPAPRPRPTAAGPSARACRRARPGRSASRPATS
ncbi:MAG: hypothetical protein IPL60_17770 [Ardenticatenia bacterium]|nr:hypothetical protein [Ardenticatenia bacterium]